MKEINFQSIDSTNLYVKNHYQSLDDFTVVVADYQTNGKGRNDRTWISEKGDNFLFSLLVKNKEIIKEASYLSLVAAVSIYEFLHEKLHIENISIKWPNDIYVNEKKICGILLEGQLPEYVVIGIGLNVNQTEFLGDYHHTPTSIYLETNKKHEISEIKGDMFDILRNNVLNSLSLKHHFYELFLKLNYLKNREVSFLVNGKFLKGKVIEIDKDFNLIIDTGKGKIRLNSGEVTILKV